MAFLILFQEFKSTKLAWIILLNLPLAMIGGVIAIRLTSGVVSIPVIIGFITLFGIATRNGILLVSRYRNMAEKGIERKTTFLFGVRSTEDLFIVDELKELENKMPNFKFIPTISRPDPNQKWDGETGFVHLAADKHLDPGVKRQAFLCGPPPMIEAVTVVLKEKGIAADDIFYDEF